MPCAPCQCCLWFLVLIFVSGPVACICFTVFYFVGPLAGCCACLEPFAEILIEGVKYPQTVAKKMCG